MPLFITVKQAQAVHSLALPFHCTSLYQQELVSCGWQTCWRASAAVQQQQQQEVAAQQ
jgi:hypothetical protein